MRKSTSLDRRPLFHEADEYGWLRRASTVGKLVMSWSARRLSRSWRMPSSTSRGFPLYTGVKLWIVTTIDLFPAAARPSSRSLMPA